MATTHPLPKFSMPPEFPDILKDFAREVLRSQPSNVYEFGVKYFDEKLKTRATTAPPPPPPPSTTTSQQQPSEQQQQPTNDVNEETTTSPPQEQHGLAVTRKAESAKPNGPASSRAGGFSVAGMRHKISEDMNCLIEAADQEIIKTSPHVQIPATRIAMVCDGHGGTASADFVSKQLWKAIVTSPLLATDPEAALKEAFKLTDDTLVSHLAELSQDPAVAAATGGDSGNPSATGCCTVCSMITGDTVWVANLGDSRCVLVKRGGAGVPLTRDHKVTDAQENQRLVDCGAMVHASRLLGVLAVARSFGDFEIKKMSKDANGQSALLNDPDVFKHVIEEDDVCLILASDGVWDVLSNQEAADICLRSLQETGNPKRACEALVTTAARKDSDDDITALVILLP